MKNPVSYQKWTQKKGAMTMGMMGTTTGLRYFSALPKKPRYFSSKMNAVASEVDSGVNPNIIEGGSV